MGARAQVDGVFDNSLQFFTMAALKEKGLTHYRINKLVDSGRLVKVARFLYENPAYTGEVNDFAVVGAYVPQGVVCLMSAARFYGLTTFLPDSVDVAICRKKKVTTLPDWPSVSLHYFADKRMEVGVSEGEENGATFRIFDIEKTVIDIIYYRNKVGIEEMREVLTNYLRLPSRNVNKLYRYASELRCESVLRTYFEVLAL